MWRWRICEHNPHTAQGKHYKHYITHINHIFHLIFLSILLLLLLFKLKQREKEREENMKIIIFIWKYTQSMYQFINVYVKFNVWVTDGIISCFFTFYVLFIHSFFCTYYFAKYKNYYYYYCTTAATTTLLLLRMPRMLMLLMMTTKKGISIMHECMLCAWVFVCLALDNIMLPLSVFARRLSRSSTEPFWLWLWKKYCTRFASLSRRPTTSSSYILYQ